MKTVLTVIISAVWLFSGLFCKLLNLVPRHRMIVSLILGENMAAWATPVIGALEILMALWILSGFKSRTCAIMQIVAVATMNVLEITLAPDLLLFGKVNGVVALVFIMAVFINAFLFGRNMKGTQAARFFTSSEKTTVK